MNEESSRGINDFEQEIKYLKDRVNFLESLFKRGYHSYWREDDHLERRLRKIDESISEVKNITQNIESCCNESSDVMHMMVAAGQRPSAIADLRGFTANTRELTIIDPYFLSGKREDAYDDAEEMVKILGAKRRDLKKVHIIYDPNNGETKERVKQIVSQFDSEGVKVTKKGTSKIHDRIWIADRTRAKVVGTSIGGLGEKRLCFILDLPINDLKELLRFLDDEKLFEGESLHGYIP